MYLGMKWNDICNLFSKSSAKRCVCVCIDIKIEREKKQRKQSDKLLKIVEAWWRV